MMTLSNANSPKTWIILVTSVVGVSGGAWGMWSYSHAKVDPDALPKELSVESLKAQSHEPGKMFETMRDLRDREDLTDEQRQKLRDNMREVFQSRMKENVDEYFAATPEQQNDVLDKQLDAFQEQMNRWEEQRKQFEKDRKPGDEERWRGNPGDQTQQERKTRSESRNPDQMARMMTYFAAMQKRANERGIKLPQWGPGRGRGPGGRGP
ncbi:MAG: hypothetical protein AABZ47_18445 [Planctomycetota bacterium]